MPFTPFTALTVHLLRVNTVNKVNGSYGGNRDRRTVRPSSPTRRLRTRRGRTDVFVRLPFCCPSLGCSKEINVAARCSPNSSSSISPIALRGGSPRPPAWRLPCGLSWHLNGAAVAGYWRGDRRWCRRRGRPRYGESRLLARIGRRGWRWHRRSTRPPTLTGQSRFTQRAALYRRIRARAIRVR
jgi:hypothetical protein